MLKQLSAVTLSLAIGVTACYAHSLTVTAQIANGGGKAKYSGDISHSSDTTVDGPSSGSTITPTPSTWTISTKSSQSAIQGAPANHSITPCLPTDHECFTMDFGDDSNSNPYNCTIKVTWDSADNHWLVAKDHSHCTPEPKIQLPTTVSDAGTLELQLGHG